MNILLRLALLALCGAGGILLAVQMAGPPVVEPSVAVATPAVTPPIVAPPAVESAPSPVVAPVVAVAQPQAVPEAVVEKKESRAVAVAAKSSLPETKTEPFEPKFPRVKMPRPRVAAQIPGATSGGGSGNSIADSERMLLETQQMLNQVRQSHQDAVKSVGADTTSDPGAMMLQILGQGGLGGGQNGAGPSAQQMSQILKMVQDAAQSNGGASQQLPAAAPGGNVLPALPGVAAPPAPAPPTAVVETLPKPPAISPVGDGRLSIHSRDDDLRILLEQLGEQAGLNILACQSVGGTISVNLNDVSIDEALAVVLKISGFVSHREGNVVYIGTVADFAALERVHDRISTRVYRPNYLSAKELSNLLTPLLTPGTGKLSITSPPILGIAADNSHSGGDALAQQDAVVIQDYGHVLAEIDQVFKELDRRPAQVSIEAVIVSVTLNDANDFGVDFQLLRNQNNVRFGWGSPRLTPLNGAGTTNATTGAVNGQFQFDTGGLKFAFLDDSLGVFINALETVGDANIIASPKLLCLNKQKAEILIGQRLGYISTTVTQTYSTQNVEFLDVGTQLRLRPFISSDGLIRMEVHPELSTGTVTVEGGFTLPNKTLTEVTTNVMCPDGCTVIIGGLMREELQTDITQVPLLGSLPGVGPLFRHKSDTVARTEILVLLTPRIIYDEENTAAGAQADADTQNIEAAKFQRMNPVGRAHLSRDYVARAAKALQNGNRAAAVRYSRLAVHYDPLNREAVQLHAQLTGGATVPPLVPQGLGATVVVGEDEAASAAGPEGEPVPEWMLNDLGREMPAPPPIPIHPREPGVPGNVLDVQRPQVFRNDEPQNP